MIIEKELNILEKDYFDDLQKIKQTIKENQYKAMVIVNSTMILTYYQIGSIINQRKQWGNKYIERLADDLKEYKGFSYDNLCRMIKLATNFTIEELVAQPVRLIPWGSLIEIMTKSSTHEEMIWYINQTHKNGWSRSMVLNQFKLKAYQRSLLEPTTSSTITENPDSDLTHELFKDTYVFDFIDVNNIKNERQLQASLLQNISTFILELGKGFSFVSEKYKLKTETETYEIDLLFYHIPTHSYVVIELKTTKFKPEYEADGFICRTTLLNTKNMAISKYKFLEELPEYLNKRLKEKKK